MHHEADRNCNLCKLVSLYNRDGPGRIQCLCSLSSDVPKWGVYICGVAEQNCGWRKEFL